jgi:hypothetical protein
MMTDTLTPQASLYGKLARAMGKLKRLRKTGKNKFFNYDFVTDADVADAVREVLTEEGIAFFASMVDCTQETIEKAKGGTTFKTVAIFEFTFADGETGATQTCLWRGESLDDQDKGISKAATAAEKYFLLKTFMLSTGDPADDSDSDEDSRAKSDKSERARPTPATASIITDDLRDRPTLEAFLARWRKEGMTDAEIAAVLGIQKWGEWTQGRAKADKAVDAWLLVNVPASKQSGKKAG